MEIKRVHIAYFSPTGTTKRTLRAVAEGFGCSELSETDWGDPKSRAAILKTGPDELVIAGMPVYYGRIPSLFHEGLPLHGEGTPFVPVAVAVPPDVVVCCGWAACWASSAARSFSSLGFT